jgi:hypothetical protein
MTTLLKTILVVCRGRSLGGCKFLLVGMYGPAPLYWSNLELLPKRYVPFSNRLLHNEIPVTNVDAVFGVETHHMQAMSLVPPETDQVHTNLCTSIACGQSKRTIKLLAS